MAIDLATVEQLEYLAELSNAKFATKNQLDKVKNDLEGIKSEGGEPNKIDEIKVNGVALIPDSDKAVDITVPTQSDINAAVAAATHLKRQKVDSIDDIQAAIDDDTPGLDNIIFMVPVTDAEGDNLYEEYVVIEGHIEPLGSTKVDLTGYLTIDDVATLDEVKAIIDPIFGVVSSETPEESV